MNEYVYHHNRLDVYAAIQDLLIATNGMAVEIDDELKLKLSRMVSMLTPMAMKFENVSEPGSEYSLSFDDEHEHCLWLSTEQK